MTTAYRQYRGLFGETVRVPEKTIAPSPRLYRPAPFPFSAVASQLGRNRNQFAELALRAKCFQDVTTSPLYRAARAQLAAA